jgi:DNA helicase-2/ATP-dependent DNA helicase PcrA
MTTFLEQLDPKQREAVTTGEGPVLVLAGAGSGKTRVITCRITWLIAQGIVEPDQILAVTFTNKAADEMRERIRQLLPANLSALPLTCTFHSLCARMLRREGKALGLTREFSLYDADAQQRLVKKILKEFGEDDRAWMVRSQLERISRSKTAGRTPDDWRNSANPNERQYASLYERYVLTLKAAQALDFDDLLLEAVRLLRKHPDVRERWQRRYRYLLVDEYQDTNPPQYQLVRLLAPPSTEYGAERPNIFVVGDEDQSIYAWRGADYGNILRFEQDFPGARGILLEQNYRSTQPILDAATAVIQNNASRKGKVLWSERKQGARVRLYEANDTNEEAQFVTEKLWDYQRKNPLQHLAVLYRTNAQSRLFEEALRQHDISYRVVGGFSFYKRTEIRDVLAYLRLARNPLDQQSLLRILNVPPRGIGNVTERRLLEDAAQRTIPVWEALQETTNDRLKQFRDLIVTLQGELESKPLDEVLEHLIRESGYERWLVDQNSPEATGRLENLHELIAAAREAHERDESASEFLDRASLASDTDDYDAAAPVTLMTLHSAKGTEFDVVFLAGLEEGLFPHSRSTDSEDQIEEERRLCYVGMTRAKEELYLVRALRRRGWATGEWSDTEPSRFLAEVPAEMVENLSPEVHDDNSEEDDEAPSGGGNGGGGGWSYEPVDDDGYAGLRSRKSARPRKPFRRSSNRPDPDLPQKVTRRTHDPAYPLGSAVQHAKFGHGRIVSVEGKGKEKKVTVDFPVYGRKKLLERFAGLRRV